MGRDPAGSGGIEHNSVAGLARIKLPLTNRSRERSGAAAAPADGSVLCRQLLSGSGLELFVLAGGMDLHARSGLGDLLASLRHHRVDPLVVVVGIVMKEDQAADTGAKSESDAVIQAAVPPTDVFWIFDPIVLRIEDEEIAPVEKIDQFRLGFTGRDRHERIGSDGRAAVGLVIGR